MGRPDPAWLGFPGRAGLWAGLGPAETYSQAVVGQNGHCALHRLDRLASTLFQKAFLDEFLLALSVSLSSFAVS